MCFDIVELWPGIANGQISSFLTVLSACNTFVFSFSDNNLSKYQRIITKLGTRIDIVGIWFRIATGQISSVFDR